MFLSTEGDAFRKERDTTGDGRVDMWEYFEDETVSRIGMDTDGDGLSDKRND